MKKILLLVSFIALSTSSAYATGTYGLTLTLKGGCKLNSHSCTVAVSGTESSVVIEGSKSAGGSFNPITNSFDPTGTKKFSVGKYVCLRARLADATHPTTADRSREKCLK